MKYKYYLAYGSNLNIKDMKYRCPNAKIAGTALLKNYRLMYKGWPNSSHLTIERASGYSVPIGVWKVTASDESTLDAYEGCPDLYYKKDIKIDFIDMNGEKKSITAFIYVMFENNPLNKPSKYYIDTCISGYKVFGFNPKYLTEALEYSTNK